MASIDSTHKDVKVLAELFSSDSESESSIWEDTSPVRLWRERGRSTARRKGACGGASGLTRPSVATGRAGVDCEQMLVRLMLTKRCLSLFSLKVPELRCPKQDP